MFRRRQLDWMRETRMAVVVSEEQGEVDKFRKWDLDITPHRRLMKEGIDLPESMRAKPEYRNMQTMALDDAFKAEEHPLRVAIVCAMWLTGFDVPSLVDPLSRQTPQGPHPDAGHRPRQPGQRGQEQRPDRGLLRHPQAPAQGAGDFRRDAAGRRGRRNRSRPDRKKSCWRTWPRPSPWCGLSWTDRHASLDDVIQKTGFERNAAIVACKEAANENDESRKRFEVMCREVFKKFKACINVQGVNAYRADRDAINIVYKSLQQDREQADITDIIRQLHQVVDEAIEVRQDWQGEDAERLRYQQDRF